MKKITAVLIIIAVAFGMVGCEKEPEAPRINIKNSTMEEIEADMIAAQKNNKARQQSGDKK